MSEASSSCDKTIELVNDFCKKVYTLFWLHGLEVWIDEDCDETEVVTCLKRDLGIVKTSYPQGVWDKICNYPFRLWVNQDFCYTGDDNECVEGQGACTHHSEEWLSTHGNLTQKAHGVEIYCWKHYLVDDLCREGTLIHEFAHAYHWILGFDQPDIARAYNKAMASGKYAKVPHCQGGARRAYAAVNELEFFASLSVPYFGLRNDYYPFSRDELIEFDPESMAVLDKVWFTMSGNVRTKRYSCLSILGATIARASLQICRICSRYPRKAFPNEHIVPTRDYYLAPHGRSSLSLDIDQNSEDYDLVIQTISDSSVRWKITPVEDDDGYYTISVTVAGQKKHLDLTNPCKQPVLNTPAGVSGQCWSFKNNGNSYQLTTMWTEEELVLSCQCCEPPFYPEMQSPGAGGIQTWLLVPCKSS